MTCARWAPQPDWEPLTGAEGSATVGVWRTTTGDGAWIVKRVAPGAAAVGQRSFAWWRREVEVATSDLSLQFRGLIAPRYRVDEDVEGATLWAREVVQRTVPGDVAARALGRFASVVIDDPGWFVAGRLRDRVELAAAAGLDRLGDAAFDPATESFAERRVGATPRHVDPS